MMKANEQVSKPIREMNQKLAEDAEKQGIAGRIAGQTAQTIGTMFPSIATSAITKNPTLATGAMALSVKGMSTQEALEKGATLQEAVKIGDTKATAEVASELISGGINIFGKGAIDDITDKVLKKVNNEVGRFLLKQGINAGTEVIEELTTDFINTFIDKGTVDPNATISMKDLGDTTLSTILTTTILNMILPSGMRADIQEGKYRQDMRNQVENSNITPEQKAILNEKIRNDEINSSELKNMLPQTEVVQNQQATMENKPVLENGQQVISNEGKIAQNQTSQQPLGNEKYLIKMPDSNYKFEKTGNQNEDNLDESMSKVFNNSEDTKKLNKTLKQIMRDKNLSIVFDANITDEAGNILDGKYENGVITINPNSTKAFEYVATHELTHAIGTKEMLNMVQKYRESNKEFNTKLETILKNYNKSELTEEALADVSAELFGTQEFIANVKNTNPNLFQKIYNEIKYLWHQFRGYKNQNQFVEDLYNKWTAAYNSNAELNQTTRNLNIGIKGFENASKNLDLIQDKETLEKYTQMRDTFKTALEMAKKGATGREILRQTNGRWTKNSQNNQIIFNISDQDIDIPKTLQRNTTYKLGDIVKHDELFFLYPKLMELKVVTTSQLDGDTSAEVRLRDKLKDSKLVLKNSALSNKERLKKDIIHELQHIVQKIEGTLTTKGYSTKDAKYFNNLLEIEAEDQVYRYENKIEDNFPEVARQKPKHSDVKNQLPLVKKQIERYNEKNGYKGVVKQDATNRRKLREIQGKNSLVFDRLRDNIRQNVWLDGKGKGSFYRQNTEKQIEQTSKEGLEESSSFNLQKNKEKQLFHQTTAKNLQEMNLSLRKAGLTDLTTPEGIFLKETDEDIGLEGKNQLKLNATLNNSLKVKDRKELNKILQENKNYIKLKEEATKYENEAAEIADKMSIEAVTLEEIENAEQYLEKTRNKMIKYAEKIQKEITSFLKSKGYDSLIIEEDVGSFGRKIKSYIVFDKSQLSEGNRNVTIDNKGRTLSKEQQEYFKDSKVRDENGKLIETYHGTPTGKFNIYDNNKLGTTTNASDSKLGIHLTDNIDLANQFKDFTSDTVKGIARQQVYDKYNIEYGLVPPKMRAKIEQEISELADQMVKENGEVKKQYINIKKPFSIFSRYGVSEEQLANDLVYALTGSVNISDTTDYFETNLEFLESIQQNFNNEMAEMKDELAKYDSIKRLKELGYDGLILPIQTTDTLGLAELGLNTEGNEYIVFNSNQIKNVDNLNPTENPDIRYSKQNAEWYDYVQDTFKTEGTRTTKEQIRLPEKNVLQENTSNLKQTTTKKETDTEIAKVLNTPVTRQKPQDRKWAIFKASVFDKGIVFEDLSKRAKNRELEAKWDYTLSSSARAQYAIGNARLDENGNKISKGLTEIIDEVGDKIDDFQNYMYHLLNIDRMSLKERFGIDNKPVFGKNIGKDYSERKVEEFEKANPKFKEWAQDVYDYANADKAELVKNGVISQELSDKFAEMYPHYVPIQRANKLGNAINLPLDTRRTGVNTPIKQAKGGSSDLNPLFETLAGRTMQTYRASARNSLGVELKNTLESLNSLNSNVNNTESLDSIMDTMADEKSTSDLLQASKDGKLPTFTVFENGNKVTFDISEDIYDALKPVSKALQGNYLWGIPNKLSNLRRAVLTEYNPLFSITNTVKDTQDVLLNSQHAYKTYKKYPEAYWQIMRNGYWKQEYIQNGGEQNTYFKDGEFEKVTKKGLLKQVVTFPLDAISKVNGALEMAPRLAEYIASREEGRSIQTSMLDASRVTTNFKAGGDVTKALNRNGFTFLNAGVQGAMQAVRNVREANVKGLKGWTMLACKMAVAGAPVLILNNLMWEDDDDYEQLQDYVKDGYYIIGKRNDGTFIRIPKGRTLAVIQKVVSNVDKYINNEGSLNIDEVSKDFWETAKFTIENLAPSNPLDNNVISPIIQTITNTSWYGEDIVPSRLQNVPNAEQFDETTDKFSKWLGEKTGVSPMKINYLLDQYGGGVSDILLPLGTPQAENTPLEDKFVTDPIMKSKYPGEFFEKSDEITKSSNSMYATDTDIVKGKYMSYIQGNMSDLYKQKREIQNSIATDEEKKRQLKEVQKQINETAKMALEDVEKPKMTSTTALIGNEEFYKNSDGEWERLKDKDKIENVSMKSYSDYKIKKEQATDKKRKEKNNEKATLNDAEMITIIKESNYTDKEKDALFDDQINDKTYKHLKLLNNNDITKINQYMDYKTADLESNRVYDGTKKGKAVSGSAKNKLTTYLNNSSFNGVERLYLYGQNYKLNSTQRAQLQYYVKKLDLTPQEEKELWLDLSSSNIVEMADGSIRWK